MFKHLLRYTRNVFNFSYAEAKGFMAMAGILAALSVFFLLYDSSSSAGYTSFQEDQAVLDSLVALMEAGRNEDSLRLPYKSANPYSSRSNIKEPERFAFNPAELPVDSLVLLGIPAGLAQRIENYRQKGGKFRKQEDLLKIYGFPDSLYSALEPLIILPVPVERPKRVFEERVNAEKAPAKTINPVNLNKADSLQLISFRGIGPVLSSRIIRFRDKLGGFVHPDQLYEVYGLDSLVVQQVLEHAFIEKDFMPEQILLNTAGREELEAHPYIKPAQAGLIFAYRSTHGPFQAISDLQKIHTLDPEFINKIAPYISLK